MRRIAWLGDALHAVLCGAGHNLRMILKKLRLLFSQILAACLPVSDQYSAGSEPLQQDSSL
jgi:hypothetical protein